MFACACVCVSVSAHTPTSTCRSRRAFVHVYAYVFVHAGWCYLFVKWGQKDEWPTSTTSCSVRLFSQRANSLIRCCERKVERLAYVKSRALDFIQRQALFIGMI